MLISFFISYRGDIQQGMNIKDALKEVLRNALIHDGLARGLREAVKALDKYVKFSMLNGRGAFNEPRPPPFYGLWS